MRGNARAFGVFNLIVITAGSRLHVIIYLLQHAYALSILSDQLFDGARALDVGSGSGYLSACMGFMVGLRGRVIGIEHIPELIEISTRNVREDCSDFLKEDRIKFVGKPGYSVIVVRYPPTFCRTRSTVTDSRCSFSSMLPPYVSIAYTHIHDNLSVKRISTIAG